MESSIFGIGIGLTKSTVVFSRAISNSNLLSIVNKTQTKVFCKNALGSFPVKKKGALYYNTFCNAFVILLNNSANISWEHMRKKLNKL